MAPSALRFGAIFVWGVTADEHWSVWWVQWERDGACPAVRPGLGLPERRPREALIGQAAP